MKVKKLTFRDPYYPEKLRQIPSAPKTLFILSHHDTLDGQPALAIVGSRKMSAYGQHVTNEFAGRLAHLGAIIVSGLALGIDSVAHKAALGAGGITIAVLPCGLDTIYPSTHRQLAHDIIQAGGALVSEYSAGTPPLRQHFIARNRIVSGLSDGVLITEAAEKSGTLHTANFALEQGKDVFAVPGNITSYLSRGTNSLIKAGATPVTTPDDIIGNLGISEGAEKRLPNAENKQEYLLLEQLKLGINDADELLAITGLQPAVFNQTLTMLEITGKIKPIGNNKWTLS